jgi:hypothetical protein
VAAGRISSEGSSSAEPIACCPLVREGGFAVYTGFVDARTLPLLRAEAGRQRAAARESLVTEAVDAERGGAPRRKFLSAPGGELQTAFLASSWLAEALSGIVGLPVRPTGGGGTFTYYCRIGDHLGLHRDILRCDVAVITALEAHRPTACDAGGLALYPGRVSEELRAIRARPQDGRTVLHLETGQTCVMLGGLVPHELLPIASAQFRTVSVLCFEVLPD